MAIFTRFAGYVHMIAIWRNMFCIIRLLQEVLDKGKSTGTVFLGSPQNRKVKGPLITCLLQQIDKKSNVLDGEPCIESLLMDRIKQDPRQLTACPVGTDETNPT